MQCEQLSATSLRSIDGDCNRTETIFTKMSIIAQVLAHLKQLQIDRNLILNTAAGPELVQQLDGNAGSSPVPTYHSTWRLTARACHYLQNYHVCSFPYMPWLQEVISFSLLRPRFDPRPMHVTCAECGDNVAGSSPSTSVFHL